MLRALSEINGYQIEATDGVIGHVTGCYFDDDTWTVTGLAVNTGGWLARREVFLSSDLLGSLYWQTATLAARLTRREVEACSSLSLDEDQHRHLRSSREVVGYHLQALDDVLGHVEDFILDTERWVIRYVAVDTSSWWFGGHALLAPRWLGPVRLREQILELRLTREALKNVPRWMPGTPITPEYEASLIEYDRLREVWSKSQQSTEAALAPRPLHRSPDEAPGRL